MKQFVSLLVLSLAVAASALSRDTASEENRIEDVDASGRFGFLTVNENGAALTFNSTSLQYAVVIGVVLLILGLIVVPIVGSKFFSPHEGYDNYYGYDGDAYSSSYTSYAKRSLDVLSPVLAALAEGYKKYE